MKVLSPGMRVYVVPLLLSSRWIFMSAVYPSVSVPVLQLNLSSWMDHLGFSRVGPTKELVRIHVPCSSVGRMKGQD